MFLPQPLASGNFVGGYGGVSAAGANATPQANKRNEAKIRFMGCLAKWRAGGVFICGPNLFKPQPIRRIKFRPPSTTLSGAESATDDSPGQSELRTCGIATLRVNCPTNLSSPEGESVEFSRIADMSYFCYYIRLIHC